jgi:hypothetical protein
MVYGIAVHKFIDAMFKTKGDMKAAREAAIQIFNMPKVNDKKKMWLSDASHMWVTCLNAWDDWILKDTKFDILKLPNGQPATELTFRLPYYEDENVVVNLCGTIDKIGKIKNGLYCVGDYKTTSSWNAEEYLSNYAMSAQLRFYALALRLMSKRHPDSMLGQVGATQMGCFIDGIFLKASAQENEYERSEVFQFKDSDLDNFASVVDQLIRKLLVYVASKTMPDKEGIVNGTCQQKFGRCKFWNVCKQQDPVIASLLLKRDFVTKPYDPLTFNE